MSEEAPTLGELYRLVQKIDKALNGNGRPGLMQTVERHDAWLRLFGGALAVVAGVVVKTVVDLAAR